MKGAVHFDEVCSAWRLQRARSLQAAVDRGADVGVQRGRLTRDGAFLSVAGQTVLVRERSAVASTALRILEMLPPQEMDAAMLSAARAELVVSPEEAVIAPPRGC